MLCSGASSETIVVTLANSLKAIRCLPTLTLTIMSDELVLFYHSPVNLGSQHLAKGLCKHNSVIGSVSFSSQFWLDRWNSRKSPAQEPNSSITSLTPNYLSGQ